MRSKDISNEATSEQSKKDNNLDHQLSPVDYLSNETTSAEEAITAEKEPDQENKESRDAPAALGEK